MRGWPIKRFLTPALVVIVLALTSVIYTKTASGDEWWRCKSSTMAHVSDVADRGFSEPTYVEGDCDAPKETDVFHISLFERDTGNGVLLRKAVFTIFGQTVLETITPFNVDDAANPLAKPLDTSDFGAKKETGEWQFFKGVELDEESFVPLRNKDGKVFGLRLTIKDEESHKIIFQREILRPKR